MLQTATTLDTLTRVQYHSCNQDRCHTVHIVVLLIAFAAFAGTSPAKAQAIVDVDRLPRPPCDDAILFPIRKLPTGAALAVAIQDLNADQNTDIVSCSYGIDVHLGKGDGTFKLPIHYPADGQPFDLVLVDLDSDGHTDVATANFASNDVSVFLGLGSGRFFLAGTYSVGAWLSGATSIASGDFNSDMIPDLAVTNQETDSLSILLGSGDGTFLGPPGIESVGDFPRWVEAGHLNGDNYLDLAVCNPGSATITILLGNGDGAFPQTADLGLGLLVSPYSLTIADLDQDGFIDIIVPDVAVQATFVFFGNGSGSFSFGLSLPVGDRAWFVDVADINLDGWVDVAVTHRSSLLPPAAVSVFRGGDSGTSTSPIVSGPLPAWGQLQIGDLDGDDVPDLAVALGCWTPDVCTHNGLAVIKGAGDGAFATPRLISVGDSPSYVGVEDLDGDSLPDLLVSDDSSNELRVFLGQGGGTFLPGPGSPHALGGMYSLGFAVGSVNSATDHSLDVVVANEASGDVSILLGSGDGTFGPPALIPIGMNSLPGSIAIGDLDLDGNVDIAIAREKYKHVFFPNTSSVYVCFGNGLGGFGPPTEWPANQNPHGIRVADMNTDGLPDLVVMNDFIGATGCSVLLGSGAGAFGPPLVVWSAGNSFDVAHLDGNSVPDIVIAGNSPQLEFLLGNGDGTFLHRSGPDLNTFVSSVEVDDINKDGLPDVVCSGFPDNAAFSGITIFEGITERRKLRPYRCLPVASYYFSGATTVAHAVADLDGDGFPDIVCANKPPNSGPFTGTLSVLLNLR